MPVTHRTNRDARNYDEGIVYVEFAATLNNTAAPSAFRGGRGVKTFVRTGVGTFTLTLVDSLREVVTAYPDLEANGGGDGSYATMTAPSGEASANNTPTISFTIFTHAAAGTLTDFNARRVKITIALKDTNVGP